MAFLKSRDAISGQEGRAYMTIGGRVEELMGVKNIEATIEKSKAEMKVVGKRGTQHKANGWNGTGSMTIYYFTTKFRQMMLDYVRTGKDLYFDLQIINEDPTSTVGKQTIMLKNVNLDGVIMAKLDSEAEMLDEEISFTFDDVAIMDQFTDPAN